MRFISDTTSGYTEYACVSSAFTENVSGWTATDQFVTGEYVGSVGIDEEPVSGSENLVRSGGVYGNITKIEAELGPKFLQVSTVDGIQTDRIIKANGYVGSTSNFIVTKAYSVIGAVKVHFKGWIGFSYHSYAFYNALGEYIYGNVLPSSSSLFEENVDIPYGASTVIFCTAASRLNDFNCSIEYSETGINRHFSIIDGILKQVEDSFVKVESISSYGELFNGTLYDFSNYCHVLNVPIFGNVSTVQVTCDNGATITVYKYERNTSILTQIGVSTAISEGDLTIDCGNTAFNGEFIAVRTSSKLHYRQTVKGQFGVVNLDGSYRQDSTFDYSIKVNLASVELLSTETLSSLNLESVLPINSSAVFDTKAATKISWLPGTMTSVGTIYDDSSVVHSEYLNANSYFGKQVVSFNSSIYAWFFFDKHYYPIEGFKPSSTQNVLINGKLPDIPSNAEYVVLNQKVSTFVELYAMQKDNAFSRLAGKSILFIGDSFIDQNNLPKEICSLLGCTAINRGISGSIVASKGGSSYQSLVDRLDGYNDDENQNEKYHSYPQSCDAIIINCSTNDYGTSVPLGTIEAGYSDKTTFYGGVHYVINKLVEKYGNTPILWINATHRNSANLPEFVINNDGTFTITRNNVNKSLKDYILALEETCEAYSIPVVDVYRNSRFQPLFTTNKETYTVSDDGLHPNAKGAKLLALRVLESIAYIGY